MKKLNVFLFISDGKNTTILSKIIIIMITILIIINVIDLLLNTEQEQFCY